MNTTPRTPTPIFNDARDSVFDPAEEDAAQEREAAMWNTHFNAIPPHRNRPRFRSGLLAKLVQVKRLTHEPRTTH